jgi:hypothetical protein
LRRATDEPDPPCCSITASYNRHVIDPFRYLAGALQGLPTTPPDRPAELLPDVWLLAHPNGARKRVA